MCNCGRTAAATTTWTVTYPDRPAESYPTQEAATIAASKVAGATVAPATP